MSTNLNRAREKLVLSIHFTLYPGVDDNFISLIHATPRRCLARRVCEVMHQCIPPREAIILNVDSIEVNHD
mgnify:FL=1